MLISHPNTIGYNWCLPSKLWFNLRITDPTVEGQGMHNHSHHSIRQIENSHQLTSSIMKVMFKNFLSDCLHQSYWPCSSRYHENVEMWSWTQLPLACCLQLMKFTSAILNSIWRTFLRFFFSLDYSFLFESWWADQSNRTPLSMEHLYSSQCY